MSDVEKAISGLIEDEELLQKPQQQGHKQHQQQQQQPATPLNKANNYNLKNETGNNLLQHQQLSQHQLEQQQLQYQQHHYVTDTKYLAGGNNSHSNRTNNTNNNCLSRILKLVFSTPGLVVMVIVYTIMGALIFPLLEAPQDISKSAIIAKSREECLKELWIITEKLNVLYERNWTMLVHEQLRRFEGTIVAATRNVANAGATSTSSSSASSTSSGIGGGAGGSSVGSSIGGSAGLAADASATTALGRFGGQHFMENNDFTTTRWSFSEALLYSVTVITTIGHGSLTPRTTGGKIATILYALIGVPLMLMCLSSLGAILAEALQCTYARLCCRWPPYDVHDDDGGGGGGHVRGGGVVTGGDGGDTSENILDDDDDDEDVDGMVQKPHRKRQHRRLGRRETEIVIGERNHLHHHADHKHGINCKNCKYDAIIGDTNTTNNIYDDYKCSSNNDTSMTTGSMPATSSASASPIPATKHGYKEGKLNHQHQLNSCMQLKMSSTPPGPTTTAQQLHQQQQLQQQHQQQYYQQRPDVMLMTTGHKLSSPATSCRLVLPNSSSSAGAAAAVPTPRFYSPPMATYHIVSSASANSSPTHQQSIRHYIIPPPTVPSSGGTHHFMAVPSNMLRFQASTVHCGSGSGSVATSNLSINPLASGSTTTVYFPFVTPAVPQNPLALSGNTTATAATILGGTSSSLASSTLQPMVKYHTIQMPHRRRQSLTLANCDTTNGQGTEEDAELLPPPPPAYQTATVHGIRRAKFLTKPLPQEINTLLHESDISCRHDLSQSSYTTATPNGGDGEQQLLQQHQQQYQTISATPSVTTTSTSHSVILSTDVAMTHQQQQQQQLQYQQSINNLYSNTSTICAAATSSSSATPSSKAVAALAAASFTNNNTPASGSVCENRESTSPLTHMSSHHSSSQTTGDIGGTLLCSGASTTVSAATAGGGVGGTMAAVVDIMEDEEEMEQQRLGNCPHGTPSRVPLLTCNTSTSTQEDKSSARSFLPAMAASFQRHTNFHNRTNHTSSAAVGQRKSMIINRKGECNLHIPQQKRRNSAICYRDHMDTSDDDEFMEGENMYKLKHLHQQHPQQTDKLSHSSHHHDDLDNNSLVSYDGSTSAQIPQVPMLVVLVILVFYVCMGTVIFALWENWSLIDGAYFCFVTLTTIGYGDFVPLKTFQGPEIQLFACCAYLLLGLVLVAMSFSILETQLIWKCKRLAVRLKLTKE